MAIRANEMKPRHIFHVSTIEVETVREADRQAAHRARLVAARAEGRAAAGGGESRRFEHGNVATRAGGMAWRLGLRSRCDNWVTAEAGHLCVGSELVREGARRGENGWLGALGRTAATPSKKER